MTLQQKVTNQQSQIVTLTDQISLYEIKLQTMTDGQTQEVSQLQADLQQSYEKALQHTQNQHKLHVAQLSKELVETRQRAMEQENRCEEITSQISSIQSELESVSQIQDAKEKELQQKLNKTKKSKQVLRRELD